MGPVIANLLEQVECAAPDQQWGVIRDVARDLLEVGDPVRLVVNQLCDAGGYLDAALALVERVLPEGWTSVADYEAPVTGGKIARAYVWNYSRQGYATPADARTRPLALLAALLKALASAEGSSEAAQVVQPIREDQDHER